MTERLSLTSSFRDPSGFVFMQSGMVYRQINPVYRENYEKLLDSGLYKCLTSDKLLIPHTDVTKEFAIASAYRIIKPDQVPFISYPYEWCFSQLQDAALATLKIQLTALELGMSLRDASAFNIQFLRGKPCLIDTLSFEVYSEGKPWIAYRQFCQHFLAPLALMAHKDLRLGTLSAQYIDGVPLDLASRLLPKRTRLSLGLTSHIHLHSGSQSRHADRPTTGNAYKLGKEQLIALLRNLEGTVRGLKTPQQDTVWQDYYKNTNYTSAAKEHKEQMVTQWVEATNPTRVWDAGANTGVFARLAADKKIFTVATDFDPVAVEYNYRQLKQNKDRYLLPLILDLTNPTHALGWDNTERMSFKERGPFDLTFCLALIHHLAIANNVPLPTCAQYFSEHTTNLIIEFVPKDDSNTQRLLAAREDIFPDYTEEGFEKAFSQYFTISEKVPVPESSRVLYLMKKALNKNSHY